MSIAPDGRLHVIWCDNRQFRADDQDRYDVKRSQLYYSFSKDGGQTWSVNEAISGPWVNSCYEGVHDYCQMISDNEGAHLAWAARDHDAPPRVYYTRINAFMTDPPPAPMLDCDGEP